MVPTGGERIAELQGALADIRRRTRCCQQQARRSAATVATGGLTASGIRKVLAVYCFSGWSLHLAVHAARQLTVLPADHLQYPEAQLVQKLFLSIAEADLLCMHDELNAQWAQARQYARKVIAEQAAFQFVRDQNLVQGCAPVSGEVYSVFHRQLGLQPPCEPTRRCVAKWAARWRKRWGVRRAILRTADAVDPTLLKEKAGPRVSAFEVPFLDHFQGPISRPIY